MKDVDIYAPADKAIKTMNRDALREFGKLKLADFDKLNVIQTVKTLYRTQKQKARRRYFEIGFEVYLLGLYLAGSNGKRAYEMAEKAISVEWVDMLLKGIDPVTMFRFETETDRKAERLAEIIEAAPAPAREIDRAVVLWSKQLGQYALNTTDEAVKKAYKDAGVELVKWVTAGDERVCEECGPLDGKIFKLEEVPPKPHRNCRCRLYPVRRD